MGRVPAQQQSGARLHRACRRYDYAQRQNESVALNERLPLGDDLTREFGATFVVQLGGRGGEWRALHVLPEEFPGCRETQRIVGRPGRDVDEASAAEEVSHLRRVVQGEHLLHESRDLGPHMTCKPSGEDVKDRRGRSRDIQH